MSKTRRPRLSWFRFYADDFLGGTGALTAPEVGQYVLLLLHQWGTKEQQLIPSDPSRLRVICRGEEPSLLVLSKFSAVVGGLRNQRLADEWQHADMEHEKGMSGNAARWGDVPKAHSGTSPTDRRDVPDVSNPRTKNQEPRTIQRTTDPPLRVGESEATPDPPPVVVDAVVSDGLIQSVGETVPRELALVSSEPSESDGARLVFDYWREQTGHSRAQWTPERAKALRDRLREEPGTMSQKIAGLMLVVDGALLDPLFNGTEKGTPYLDFENLFVHKGRNRIEKLQNIARRGGQRAPQSDRSRETIASIKAEILGGMK